MKKSIFALLFLLLLLIGTCVYQKTYTLYALTHNEDNHNLQVTELKEPIPLKKEKKQILTTEQTVTTNKPIIKNEVEIDKKPLETPSLFEKIKTTVTNVISSEDTKDSAVTQIKKKEKPSVMMAQKETLNTEVKEEEVVDYLLSILNEQEDALSKRDVSEKALHTLIKRVLEERRLAIENMEKTSLKIDTEHQEKLHQRDMASQDIDKNHTERKGK